MSGPRLTPHEMGTSDSEVRRVQKEAGPVSHPPQYDDDRDPPKPRSPLTDPPGVGPEHYLDIVFDGPPSHTSGRFVEVEDQTGKSVNAGEWVERADGMWALRIPKLGETNDFPQGKLNASDEGGLQVAMRSKARSISPLVVG